MSGYALTPLAIADIFDIWSYIAEDSEDTADREICDVDLEGYYSQRSNAMPMKNPPHPGDFIRTEIIETRRPVCHGRREGPSGFPPCLVQSA
jgi:hypothetical protein